MTARTNSNVFANVVMTTGIMAGILDGLGAIAHYSYNGGRTPEKIFSYIASAVFGPAALTGGENMIMAGVIFHLIIAMGWSVLYFLAAARIKLLRENILASAVLYGAFVWVIMNRIVVPLSRITPSTKPFDPKQALIAAMVLMVCIALPNAIRAKGYYAAYPPTP